MRSRMSRTYLGGALQRIPVDGDGIVRHFLDAANEANRVLRICRRRAVQADNQWGISRGKDRGILKTDEKKCERWEWME